MQSNVILVKTRFYGGNDHNTYCDVGKSRRSESAQQKLGQATQTWLPNTWDNLAFVRTVCQNVGLRRLSLSLKGNQIF